MIPEQAFEPSATLVNDVHSALNATRVQRIVTPRSFRAIRAAILEARAEGRAVSVAGGRHAMGGQQFVTDGVLLDLTAMNRVLDFDLGTGQIEVEAGIQWPALVGYLVDAQRGRRRQWGIVQKQTGADRLSLGGALAANVHGRGLGLKPIIADVEAFTLVDAEGKLIRCDRQEDSELFRLAIGGYGLFGVIASVRLRLAPQQRLERVVTRLEVDGLAEAFEQRIAAGYRYGDFQFSIDDQADDYLRGGIFSCYRPVAAEARPTRARHELSTQAWQRLLYLAHTDKRHAVDAYTSFYLSTSGQRYWSDTHQLTNDYLVYYHQALDRQLGAAEPATEIITELYVPRPRLADFLADVRADFLARAVDLIYGTVRLIERDDESFLAWAREPYACVVFNLHTRHTPTDLERSAEAFRGLIELAIRRGGSYYLTYHRFATHQQLECCYPQFPEFLRLKRRYDPEECFQSDWYRHYRAMFADRLGSFGDA